MGNVWWVLKTRERSPTAPDARRRRARPNVVHLRLRRHDMSHEARCVDDVIEECCAYVCHRVVCDPKIKSGRRMTHTAVHTETYILHTRDALYDTCERAQWSVLPYARRVMLSGHRPGRDISRGDSGMP